MNTIKGSILLSFFSVFSFAVKGQDDINLRLKRSVESQEYIFIADQLFPQSDTAKLLSPGYDLSVSKNKLIAHLPYFGRVYTPTISSDGGIKFTSSDFEYNSLVKKDGWEISIKPRDIPDVRFMQLTIFDNGRASLYITSNNRESITYSGKVRATGTGEKVF